MKGKLKFGRKWNLPSFCYVTDFFSLFDWHMSSNSRLSACPRVPSNKIRCQEGMRIFRNCHRPLKKSVVSVFLVIFQNFDEISEGVEISTMLEISAQSFRTESDLASSIFRISISLSEVDIDPKFGHYCRFQWKLPKYNSNIV